MDERQKEIHDKGFDFFASSSPADYINGSNPAEYNRIKIGTKYLDDAILELGSLRKIQPMIFSKDVVLRALFNHDIPLLRRISNHFYHSNGIYQRACNYLAYLYKYDWYIEPEVFDDDADEEQQEKILKNFVKILNYLDNSHIKQLCNEIALKVIVNGVYYGYIVEGNKEFSLQDLPPEYCRSRYKIGNKPAIEFNMQFFDDKFTDANYRLRVLKLFPEEFQKGYVLYKKHKLQGDNLLEAYGRWYLLDPEMTIKFSLNNNEMPLFINSIPAILDLDAAQDLDRKKQMQKLLKIIIQTLPLDKNNDLVFDLDEAKALHNNAVEMLSRAVGVDILTTPAQIDSIDLSDRNTSTTTDDLERVERTVYESLGISQNLFDATGNIALDKSIANDEAIMRNLILQYESFFDGIITRKSPKKIGFNFYMLNTTQYNYKDLSKMYKEHTQLGFSKILPQVALGHSQSSLINTAYFENSILHLTEIMIPALMSSVMSGDSILNKKTTTSTQSTSENDEGRPELPDDEKSDKTIANKEALG